MACGVSRRGVSVLVPVPLTLATKPFTGLVPVSGPFVGSPVGCDCGAAGAGAAVCCFALALVEALCFFAFGAVVCTSMGGRGCAFVVDCADAGEARSRIDGADTATPRSK